jgi:hypothetical protein
MWTTPAWPIRALPAGMDKKPFPEGNSRQRVFPPLSKWGGIFRGKTGFLKLFLDPWIKGGRGKRGDGEKGDQRSSPRYNISPKVLAYSLRPHVSQQPYWGAVKNLSKKGVCIETPEPLSAGQLLVLDFQSPGKKRVQTPARVVWCRNHVSGLEFLDPSGMEEFLSDI